MLFRKKEKEEEINMKERNTVVTLAVYVIYYWIAKQLLT